MKSMDKIKDMLCTELEVFSKKPNISTADLDKIHKLTDTIKNLDKIEMFEDEGEYSEARGGRGRYSYDMHHYDDYSMARGRKRDSMGRYSRDDGMSYDGYDDGMSHRGRYSRDDAKDHMMNKLGEMMDGADPNEREILKETMRKLERA